MILILEKNDLDGSVKFYFKVELPIFFLSKAFVLNAYIYIYIYYSPWSIINYHSLSFMDSEKSSLSIKYIIF
jgi:hypothetical protein